jgi:signal transduction histidine kinase
MSITTLVLSVIIILTLILQVVAIIFAMRLIKRTKYNAIWILYIIGFVFIAVERYFELLNINGEIERPYIPIIFGTGVSICVSIAVMFAHRLVNYLDHIARQRAQLNRRILNAVLKTEERSKLNISKELHDGLGPLLSSAKMSLSVLSREKLSEQQREIVGNTAYVIDEAIRSVREISNNLSPQVLIDFGLAQAIRNFTSRCEAMHSVAINFSTTLGKERFDDNVEVVVYRVACELINNSLRHSGCTKIDLSLESDNTTLTLQYSDNGCGFEPQAMVDCGMGLSNISSRVNSLGGHLDIQSSAGNGMSATITIKLNSAHNG